MPMARCRLPDALSHECVVLFRQDPVVCAQGIGAQSLAQQLLLLLFLICCCWQAGHGDAMLSGSRLVLKGLVQ